MKKNKNSKIVKVLSVILIALIILAVLVLKYKNSNDLEDSEIIHGIKENKFESPEKNEDALEQTINEIEILSIGSYEGYFPEDGSDEEISNVMFIKIRNNGKRTLQYAEIYLTIKSENAEFSFSTLAPGKEMYVIEKNRLEYVKGKVKDVRFENVVYFEEEPQKYDDRLEVQELDSALNIKNISEKDIEGPIAIYYKNKITDAYFGGITYRVIIEDTLKVGEIRQVMTKHFAPEKSEVLFVTLAE